MADLLTRLNEDVENIKKLGDNPNSQDGLTAAALKAWFDKAPQTIKTYLNTVLIPQIESKFGTLDNWIVEADKKMNEFVAGTGFLPIDGSSAMTGNLDMQNHTVVNVADPVDKTDAVNKRYADDINTKADNAQRAADSKCAKLTFPIKLPSSGWTANSQMVSVPGVLADSEKCDVLVSPVEASRVTYADCVVRCIGQGDNSLTFKCDDTPTEELTVCVIVLI